MQHVTIALPDELSAALASPGQDLSRSAFEALARPSLAFQIRSRAALRSLETTTGALVLQNSHVPHFISDVPFLVAGTHIQGHSR